MMSRVITLVMAAGVLLITAGCSSATSPTSETSESFQPSETSQPSPSESSESTAALCASVDTLEESVSNVTTVDLSQGTLAELQDNLTQVRTDLGQVKDDAKDEFATEIAAVEDASASVGSSLDAATAAPSAEAITDVRAAIRALGTSLTTLGNAVQSTC